MVSRACRDNSSRKMCCSAPVTTPLIFTLLIIMLGCIPYSHTSNPEVSSKSETNLLEGGTTVHAQCGCCMGAPGMPGTPGAHGMHGARGADGQRGDKGERGEKGDTGAAGPIGPNGDRGARGSKGAKGEPGTTSCQTAEEEEKPTRSHIAFSVMRTAKLGPVKRDTAVTFDRVITNAGSGFDEQTSRFICRKAATYVFAVHLVGQARRDVYAWLMRNSSHEVPLLGDGRAGHGSGSQTLVLHLEAGEYVWLQLRSHSALLNDYSTFSGYSLQPL